MLYSVTSSRSLTLQQNYWEKIGVPFASINIKSRSLKSPIQYEIWFPTRMPLSHVQWLSKARVGGRYVGGSRGSWRQSFFHGTGVTQSPDEQKPKVSLLVQGISVNTSSSAPVLLDAGTHRKPPASPAAWSTCCELLCKQEMTYWVQATKHVCLFVSVVH